MSESHHSVSGSTSVSRVCSGVQVLHQESNSVKSGLNSVKSGLNSVNAAACLITHLYTSVSESHHSVSGSTSVSELHHSTPDVYLCRNYTTACQMCICVGITPQRVRCVSVSELHHSVPDVHLCRNYTTACQMCICVGITPQRVRCASVSESHHSVSDSTSVSRMCPDVQVLHQESNSVKSGRNPA